MLNAKQGGSMHKQEKHIETLAVYIHGALSTLHAVGLVHNIKRRNWRDAAIHAGFIAYDAFATYTHHQYIKQKGS